MYFLSPTFKERLTFYSYIGYTAPLVIAKNICHRAMTQLSKRKADRLATLYLRICKLKDLKQ